MKPKALTHERTRVDQNMATLLEGEDSSPGRSSYDPVPSFATRRRAGYTLGALGFTDR
jgi:hypothetical protein